MEVLQHYSLTRFMGFVPRIKKEQGEWFIVEVCLTGKTHHNSAYIALKLRDYFAGRDGAIFICNSSNILVLAHMGKDVKGESLSNGIHKKLPEHSCMAQTTDMTPDGLVRVQLSLKSLEQDNQLQPGSSALFIARQQRQERIVMVVDDDMMIRSIVSKTFHTRSRVFEFNDSRGVLDAYLDYLPDVIFLDIHLPGGSGIELLREILCFDDTAYVIILSSDSVKNNIVNAKELGAKGFVAKPFTLEKLESCYRNCLMDAKQRIAKVN